MKTKLSLLLFSLLLRLAVSQETSPPPSEAPVILNPITPVQTSTTQAAPEYRLDIPAEDVLSSKTVNEGDHTVTIQEVKPQEIPEVPKPASRPPISAEQRAALLALRTSMHESLMYSCTVYDGGKTQITWQSKGKQPSEMHEAWSNINFHNLSHLYRFKDDDVTYTLMMGIGDFDSVKRAEFAAKYGKPYTPPSIPTLPDDSNNSPSYVVTKGNPSAADRKALDVIHELFKINHIALTAAYQKQIADNAARAAELKANPPQPKDYTIQFWKVEKSNNETTEGGDK